MADNSISTVEEVRQDTNFEQRPIQDLDDKKALMRMLGDMEQAEADKSDALVRALRYDHIYRALDPPDADVDEASGLVEEEESRFANTYMPIGAAIVDSAVAQMFNLIFSTGDYFKMDASDLEDTFFETEVTEFLKKRHTEMKLKRTVYKALLQACCFDYAVTGTRWLLQGGYQPRPKRTVETIELAGHKMRKQVVKAVPVWIPDKIDRSDVFILDYFNCFPDPTSTNGFADSRFFLDRRQETIEELIGNAKVVNRPWGKYKNIDKVLRSAHNSFKNEMANLPTNMDTTIRQAIFGSRRVTINRYWTKHHIIEEAFNHVIRRINVFDWALQEWTVFPKPRLGFGGMGFLQRLERNQYDINASLNSRRNLQNLISNPFAIVDEELLGDDDGAPDLYPGRIMPMKSGGKASDKIFIYQPGVHSSQTELVDLNMQLDMTQKLSAVDDNAFGTVHGDRTTAQEIRTAAAGRMTRIGTTTQRFEDDCLVQIYLNQFFLEMTYMDKTEVIRYFGEQGERIQQIDSSSFMWNSVPRFTPMGTISILEDAVKMQQFFTAVQLAAGMPQVQHNWNNIALQMWRYLHPKEYYKFVKDPNMPDVNIPPDLENQLMATGKKVDVSPANDHAAHKPAHEAYKRTPDYIVWPESRKMLMEQHLAEHDAALAQAGNAPSLQGLLGSGQQDSSDQARGVRGPLLQATGAA